LEGTQSVGREYVKRSVKGDRDVWFSGIVEYVANMVSSKDLLDSRL
jgi:hypothetical protein